MSLQSNHSLGPEFDSESEGEDGLEDDEDEDADEVSSEAAEDMSEEGQGDVSEENEEDEAGEWQGFGNAAEEHSSVANDHDVVDEPTTEPDKPAPHVGSSAAAGSSLPPANLVHTLTRTSSHQICSPTSS